MKHHTNPLPQFSPFRFNHLIENVEKEVWSKDQDLEVFGAPVSQGHKSLEEAASLKYTRMKPNSFFGKGGNSWAQRWAKTSIPAAKKGQEGRRYLKWDCEGEMTVYVDGKPWVGLDVGHREAILPDHACELMLDIGLWQTGIWAPGAQRGCSEYGCRFEGASIVIKNETAWELFFDLQVIQQIFKQQMEKEETLKLERTSSFNTPVIHAAPLVRRLLQAYEDICDAEVAGGFEEALKATKAFYKSMPAEAWQPTAALCGHAHIDLVWLWPELMTEKKGVHSFATLMRMMEKYPELTFVQSQPSLYRAIEKREPALMREIEARIQDGRWEMMGGFEVEPDVNIPCGEALARSLVIGQKKTKELTGKHSPVCWLPDVFGYSNCLPQILKLGGVKYFYTTKMTWSCFTRFPYNSFVWKASDGTEVLAHLASFGYNGDVHAGEVNFAMKEHRQLAVHDEMLLPQGFGDGGGGITEAQCERARRIKNFSGTAKAKWTTSESFFKRLNKKRDQLPVYQGELYLEYHRGTYTSQSEFKRLFRGLETALQTYEAVRCLTGEGPIDETYWQRLTFGQFHDAIPGSSIREVYEEMNAEYAQLIEKALKSAAEEYQKAFPGDETVVMNPLARSRVVLVEVDSKMKTLRPSQTLSTGKQLIFVNLPALGAVPLEVSEQAEAKTKVIQAPWDDPDGSAALETKVYSSDHIFEVSPVKATKTSLSNGNVEARFDEKGQLVHLEINDIELTDDGAFFLYHDDPHMYDAWEIDPYTAKTGERVADDMKLKVVEKGPLRAVLQGVAKIGDASTLTVRYILEAHSDVLKMEADVDWKETHRLLKYHAATGFMGRQALFGTPFGSIERPQLPGDESDTAMWEVPASRWAVLKNEQDVGLSMITEAKYGFSCYEGNLGLSLLKAAVYPDETADKGQHRIRWALGLYDQEPGYYLAASAHQSEELYVEALVIENASATSALINPVEDFSPSWVSPSYTKNGVVLRLPEAYGHKVAGLLETSRPVKKVTWVDFHERALGKAIKPEKTEDGNAEISLQADPFQIVSLLVEWK